MFAVFYRDLKSTANIYSIDKYKDLQNRQSWLIVTTKEWLVLKADDTGRVICQEITTPTQVLENDNVSCKCFNMTSNGKAYYIWVIA